MLSNSIQERAFIFIENGVEVLEAVKMAIIEENKLISEILEQKTERSIKAKNQICKNVFGICNIL